MTFNDIFKSSFLNSVSEFSVTDTLIAMLFAFLIGLFIYFVYRKTFKGVMISTGFSLSLVLLPMVTALVILAVTSNVVLSLGMVGALSIVRFRSAIKEPMEIVYLFWAIAVGIVVGAGMVPLAVIGSVIIGVIMLIFSAARKTAVPYVLIVRCRDEAAEKAVERRIKSNVKKYMVKSKTVSSRGIELTYEVRLQGQGTSFISSMTALEGVASAVLVSYNGEYLS
ncbi:MAG: DUF4956 domain-containing protein [Christensenellaceae bacterium]|nr:DUF4956 domain-containing protein [Christensenellaceae bacterium]